MYREIMNLIVVTQSKDGDGYPTESETLFEAYANKKSVVRSEFYQSLQSGNTATAVFETRVCDFDEATVTDSNGTKHKPTRIEHEGDRYNIIRSFSKDDEMLEITCSDLGVAQ